MKSTALTNYSVPQKIKCARNVKFSFQRIIISFICKTGSFLVAKKDAQTGDPLKHPCIWKIDGKALLQKYEPFEEEGKIRHRNTSIVRFFV